MTTAGDPVAKVHHLPCNIEHTGTAPVASYFMPNETGPNAQSERLVVALACWPVS
jgi:hypothetical protein